MFGAALLLLVPQAQAKTVSWDVDQAHTTVGFEVRHMGLNKVRGQFKAYGADIKADDKTGKVERVEAWADAASINTGVDKRDAHLRSDDFFNAEAYPKLKLKTRSIQWDGDKFTAVADVTIRNKTKTVSAQGELLGVHTVDFGGGPETKAGYTVSATINRKDFDLKFNSIADGVPVVSDQVTIQIELQMTHKVDGPRQAMR